MTLKCQAFLRLMVQFLTSLDQNGNIGLASLETEMEKLLEYIVIFNPPGEENDSFYLSYHLGYVHTAHSSGLFFRFNLSDLLFVLSFRM